MLRINPNLSAHGAKSYYSTADYYTEGQELTGQWRGEGALRLGLTGAVQKEDWDALCDNRNPATGEPLTLRHNDHRRIGYDFNFHVPKSVSILYSQTKDERILDAFRESVDETMRDMESEMKTRVRKSGRNEDRTTGNMVWGEFTHFTSRPVDGIPDPHLHAHCFAFNTTWDHQEQAWKAGQFGDLKRDASYFEALFHSRFAQRMTELGVAVERTKTGWEVAGVSPSAIDKFSRRTAQIEEEAKRKGITDAAAKSELGAKTRARKRKDLSFDELRAEWHSRLTEQESLAIDKVAARIGGAPLPENPRAAKDAIQFATDNAFERKSVVPERQLQAAALRHAYGQASAPAVLGEFAKSDLIVGERGGRRFATTRDVLREEQRMIAFARDGRGTLPELSPGSHVFQRDWLGEGQCQAVLHVLHSRDRVTLIRGAAGVGKTSMMQEAVEGIEAAGTHVFTFAPSADASRGVLRSEGFDNADTVAKLMADENLQRQVRGQVIWVDEAGLLSVKGTSELFELADRLDARVILSGDRRQHSSVERGAALRLLEEEAGVVPAEIKEIQRQTGDYKQAVGALSEGRTEAGFRQLDALGWVREESKKAHRYKALASDYVSTVESGQTALVVSPTHAEANRVTRQIRVKLKRVGRLGKDEQTFATLRNKNLTQAQRSDGVNYEAGDVLVFQRNGQGFERGQRVAVGEGTLPLNQADRFQVFHRETLALAPGDTIRITQNGQTADGQHRLNNGAIYTVKRFDQGGDIVLNNGWKVSKDYGHWTYGYVVTSHASQGKTVDHVIIGQSADSFPASSREQFYVSVSRGRKRATIYTDDRAALLEAVRHTDERLSATEFVARRSDRERIAHLQRQEALSPRLTDLNHRQPNREDLTYDR